MTSHKTTLWFSYIQEEYDPTKLNTAKFWTGKLKRWNWDGCRFSFIPIGDNKVRLVIRRRKFFNRDKRKEVEVDLMISIVVLDFNGPIITKEKIREGNNIPETQNHERKIIELTVENDLRGDDRPLEKCQIWQLSDDDDGTIEKLIEELKTMKRKPASPDHDVIFDHEAVSDRIIPVIYQPRVDAWKNMLHKVHLEEKRGGYILATVVYDDENLIQHWYLDVFYRIIRFFGYGRIKDIESFKIKFMGNETNHFVFENIYSNNHQLYHDTIHGDEPPAPDRPIKHWHVSKNHPIVFVNTANHAMAEFDTNHAHWKWEYVPWDESGPIELTERESGLS